MSYIKLFNTTRDHAVGYQSVNQAADNGAALLATYLPKHTVPGVTPSSGAGYWNRNFLGQHNDPLVARAVGEFLIDTSNLTPALLVLFASGLWVGIPTRVDIGVWRISVAITGLYFAVATPRATAAGERKANCYLSFGPNGSSITVTTWEKSGGWAPADYDFCLAAWGRQS